MTSQDPMSLYTSSSKATPHSMDRPQLASLSQHADAGVEGEMPTDTVNGEFLPWRRAQKPPEMAAWCRRQAAGSQTEWGLPRPAGPWRDGCGGLSTQWDSSGQQRLSSGVVTQQGGEWSPYAPDPHAHTCANPPTCLSFLLPSC